MYTHYLAINACEVLPDEAIKDNVYKHVVYIYITNVVDAEGKPDKTRVAGQPGVVYLDDPDLTKFIPSGSVTREVIKAWVEAKLDIPALQAKNIAELSK